MHFLDLPFDIRYKIYQYAFPQGPHIYIQADRTGLQSITPGIPTAILRTCRALNADASEHLYNSYIFNVVGRKQACLATYKKFLEVVRSNARNEVHVDAFSNGAHSATMCISIQSGEGRMQVLKNRERGEPKEIHELELEVAAEMQSRRHLIWSTYLYVLAGVFAVGAMAIAFVLSA